ncbi:AAA family ATPase [Actinoplanes teichomyceticus]|uniref:AAA family ATPase n=1 Tax=Actinoplanes teichomyceticus TaxID=1867 RepID=UPI0013DDDD79|nr:AAA family ATPase [Actinoplanes teichomyceticus]
MANRDSFKPAPTIKRKKYKKMDAEAQRAHTMDRLRTCANLPMQETPMSLAITDEIDALLIMNSLVESEETVPGVMTTGGGFQGKTETICRILAKFEEYRLRQFSGSNPRYIAGTRDEHIPVVYVQTPAKPTPKRLCERILRFFGADYGDMNEGELTNLVHDSLRDHDVCVLAIDDITRLKLYRKDDEHALNLLREFMDMGITLMLTGVDIPGSGLRGPVGGTNPSASAARFGDDLPEQLGRRCPLYHLMPFRRNSPEEIEAWTTHLKVIEDYLPLWEKRPGMLTEGTMPEYLFRRTNGVVGLLKILIRTASFKAITSGGENITQSLLDTCTIDPSKDNSRVAAAGEVPDVPRAPLMAPAQHQAGKRPHNGTLDDQGIPDRQHA